MDKHEGNYISSFQSKAYGKQYVWNIKTKNKRLSVVSVIMPNKICTCISYDITLPCVMITPGSTLVI